MSSASPIKIVAAQQSHLSSIQRFAGEVNVAYWLENSLNQSGCCLVAMDEQQVAGAIHGRWLAPQLGSLSGPISSRGSTVDERLLDTLLGWFRDHRVRLLTALRATDDPLHDLMRHYGFASVARLSFMVATRLNQTCPSALTANVVDPNGPNDSNDLANRQRWIKLLDATFEGTMDCPALRPLVNAEDTISTFLGSPFDEQQWLIATLDGRDVGCLILGFDAEEEAVETLYLGVAPAFRGGGFGKQLMHIAFAAARQRRFRRVGLGVDAANRPAVSLYEQCGFYEYDARDLLYKAFAYEAAT